MNLSRNGVVRYNRVEGLFAGYRVNSSLRQQHKVSFHLDSGYGFGLRDARWEVGATYKSGKASLSASVLDRTETNDHNIIRTTENTFSALQFKGDYRDYFRAKNRFSASAGYQLHKHLKLQSHLTAFAYRSMPVKVEWNILRNADAFRPNPSIREGNAGHLQIGLVFDNRRKGLVTSEPRSPSTANSSALTGTSTTGHLNPLQTRTVAWGGRQLSA